MLCEVGRRCEWSSPWFVLAAHVDRVIGSQPESYGKWLGNLIIHLVYVQLCFCFFSVGGGYVILCVCFFLSIESGNGFLEDFRLSWFMKIGCQFRNCVVCQWAQAVFFQSIWCSLTKTTKFQHQISPVNEQKHLCRLLSGEIWCWIFFGSAILSNPPLRGPNGTHRDDVYIFGVGNTEQQFFLQLASWVWGFNP